MDTGGGTVGGGVGWILWSVGELMFKWVPGAVTAVAGTAPDQGAALPVAPITQPITTTDVVQYLQTSVPPSTYENIYSDWSTFVALGALFSILFSALIIFCAIRIRQIRHYEYLQFKKMAHPVAAKDVPKTQLRWARIVEQARSDSEQSWRLAILEADIMLNELLDMRGYKGETMGEKMKNVERSSFNTIDLAWEAHLVRNKIAHQGSEHLLTAREARRVIELYRTVFNEFKIVE